MIIMVKNLAGVPSSEHYLKLAVNRWLNSRAFKILSAGPGLSLHGLFGFEFTPCCFGENFEYGNKILFVLVSALKSYKTQGSARVI